MLKKDGSRLHFGPFWGAFWEPFWSKNGPGATSDRFFGEKRDSEQTVVITMYLAHFTGPEGTQTRLWAGF